MCTDDMKAYRKKGVIFARKHENGDTLPPECSVSIKDDSKRGGWVAFNPNNMANSWFINKEFFEENYEETKIN